MNDNPKDYCAEPGTDNNLQSMADDCYCGKPSIGRSIERPYCEYCLIDYLNRPIFLQTLDVIGSGRFMGSKHYITDRKDNEGTAISHSIGAREADEMEFGIDGYIED
ncbi:MAG: hypothetical protein GY861_17145 [bacterium]|nr:hypothetical protein [bacterium]